MIVTAIVVVVVVVDWVSSLYRLSNSLELTMFIRAITTLIIANCQYAYSNRRKC